MLTRYVHAGEVDRSAGVSAGQHEEFARLSWLTLCRETAADKTSPVALEDD